MSVTQVRQNVRPTMAVAPQRSTERHHEAFSQVAALPQTFSIHPNDTVNFYRARTDNKNVVLRVLKGKLSCLNQVLVLQSIPAKWLTNKGFPFFVSKMLFKVKNDKLLTVTGNVKSNSLTKYLFFPRNSHQQWETEVFGVCFLCVWIGAASLHTCAARRYVSAVAFSHGGGRATAERPAGLPVEMQTGRATC